MRVLQIKCTLRYTKPPIWRRLRLPESASLQDLHEILQVAMGWLDCHLFAFDREGRLFLNPDLADPHGDWRDARKVSLAELQLKEKDRFRYSYDFGDGWEHDLLVEAVASPRVDEVLPVCLKGRRACPPENCGGVPGYDRLLEAVSSPESVDSDFLEWVPEDFDPDHFPLVEVNELLLSLFSLE